MAQICRARSQTIFTERLTACPKIGGYTNYSMLINYPVDAAKGSKLSLFSSVMDCVSEDML